MDIFARVTRLHVSVRSKLRLCTELSSQVGPDERTQPYHDSDTSSGRFAPAAAPQRSRHAGTMAISRHWPPVAPASSRHVHHLFATVHELDLQSAPLSNLISVLQCRRYSTSALLLKLARHSRANLRGQIFQLFFRLPRRRHVEFMPMIGGTYPGPSKSS